MWGCNYLSFEDGRWGGWFPGSPEMLLICGLIFFLAVLLAVLILKSWAQRCNSSSRDRIDSLSILKARFAKGEITREEFVRMKEVLS